MSSTFRVILVIYIHIWWGGEEHDLLDHEDHALLGGEDLGVLGLYIHYLVGLEKPDQLGRDDLNLLGGEDQESTWW